MTEDERQRIIRQKLCRIAAPPPAFLSTGITGLDEALRVGGLPRGRIVEFFGPEASGKTAVALLSVAAVQRQGGSAAFIDVERTFDPRQALAMGVELGALVLARPQWGEQALEMARSLASSRAVDLVVVDSAAALVPKLELETGLESSHGLQVVVLTRALRRLASSAARSGACILFLNQLRSGPGPDACETTAGGRALKAYAAVRAELRPLPAVGGVRFRVVRNKLGRPFGETDIDIRWNSAP